MDRVDVNPTALLRQALLSVSRNEQIRQVIEKAPVSRDVVRRFVAGANTQDVVDVAGELVATRRHVSIDFLGEDTTDPGQAEYTKDAYVTLLQHLADAGLSTGGQVEVSLKLSALGQALGRDGNQIALEHAREICQAAANAGTTVTLDMEDHTTVDRTLAVLHELRQDWPWVGAVLQAYLYRTEQDCRDLAVEGSRVRLCKGAYKEPETVAFQAKADVDKAYVRCLRILLEGPGYPMIASHDPRLIEIAAVLADKAQRSPDSFEFQMLHGIRPEEQLRLAATGSQIRVYVPFGDDWYGYLMRRMAEKPANLMFFLRALATKG